MTNSRIKRSFSIVAHGPNVVELRKGVWNTVSFTLTDEGGQGKLFRVLSSLDGTKGPARIAKEHGLKTPEVEALLDHLAALDVLEQSPLSAIDYYLDDMVPGLKPISEEEPTTKRVVLLGDTDLVSSIRDVVANSVPNIPIDIPEPSDPARKAWESANTEDLLKGLELEERTINLEPWQDALVVLAQRTIRPDLATSFNRLARTAKLRWMNAAIDGPFLFIGPTFESSHGPCYECLDTRIMMNVRDSQTYQDYKNALVRRQVVHGEVPLLHGLKSCLAAHAGLEISNYLVAGANFTRGKILSIYLPTMAFAYHDVLQLPGCSGCGSSSEREDPELYFDLRALAES